MFVKLSLLAGACLALCFSAAEAQVTFKFIEAGDAAKMVFDPARAKEAANVASGEGFSMALTKRTQSSFVEKHEGWDEQLVIQEGEIVLNISSTAANPKEIRPGEWHADAITGGQTRLMHAGDIVIIPANTWHEEVLRTPTMRYILFKTKHVP